MLSSVTCLQIAALLHILRTASVILIPCRKSVAALSGSGIVTFKC
uniref:Uncharacterized protein n=1 Tax=Arundo donax TaxID=35708 RepID=A0A0A8YLT2_ARUDO